MIAETIGGTGGFEVLDPLLAGLTVDVPIEGEAGDV
jgi:hypothetical protein